jgi:thiamine biosynthesis lipoprotein
MKTALVRHVMFVACIFSLMSHEARADKHFVHRSRSAMGTEVSITAYTDDDAGAERAIAAAFDEIDRLEQMMTTWRATSEISQINANAGVAPVKVSDEVIEVLEMSARASKLSGGAFDVTFYAMHGLWKFDEDMERKIPPASEIKKRIALIDYRQVKIDPQAKTVFLAKKGMAINLGGIAKGYAVDRATGVLRRMGFPDAIVQAGGDLFCAGSKDGKPWSAGIRDPRGERGSVFAKMELIDHAFSTAGDYERSFILNGRRYHHIIDPKTGYPATRSRAVTIYAPTALLADALDDAVFILGWQKGFEMIEAIDDVGAVVVDDQGKVHVSKRVQDRVKVLKPPTNGL